MAPLYFSAMHPGVWEEKEKNGAAARGKKISGGESRNGEGGILFLGTQVGGS